MSRPFGTARVTIGQPKGAKGPPHLPDAQNIVDIDVDPLTERVRRRHSLLRIGLPIAGVSLIIGFLLGIAIYADRANRSGVLGLSDTLLRSLRDRIALQVSAYLEPAAHATLLAHSMLGRGGATTRSDEARAFASSVLTETPQIANVLFADAAGNFMLVRRSPGGPPGFTDTKRVLLNGADRRVEWATRDAAGQVTATWQDPSDDYNARSRSWFKGANATGEVFWSGVYVFFSERTPGVTASVHGPDKDPDVVGVDIKLDQLSSFLGSLAIGQTGRAYIVAKDGEMVAGADPSRILRDDNGQLAPALIGDIGDPAATASWDHYRAQGPGDRVIDVADRPEISIVTPLAANSQGWLLVITVPQDEFSGFVTANSRRVLEWSLSVVVLAAGLGVLLVSQGLKADRAARETAERSLAVRRQSAAFARLADEARRPHAPGQPPHGLTEILAEATGARRAGLWRLERGGEVFRCEDSFEPATGGHISGPDLARREVPALIEALGRGEEIDAVDAKRDPRTASLHRSVMELFGSLSVIAIPVIPGGLGDDAPVGGAIILEDSRHDPATLEFIRACGKIAGARMPAAAPGSIQQAASAVSEAATRDSIPDPSLSAPDSSHTATPGSAVPPRAMTGAPDNPPNGGTAKASDAGRAAMPAEPPGLDASLAAAEPAALNADGQAAILVLNLPEAALSQPASDGRSETVAQRVAAAVQDMAATYGIVYVRMLGGKVVAACGYELQESDRSNSTTAPPDTNRPAHDAAAAAPSAIAAASSAGDSASRLADMAIGLRERIEALLDAIDGPSAFGIGLDIGDLQGGTLGSGPALFNLWGEAATCADALALSAPDGGIQASDQAYKVLRHGFLFRPRGLFFRPGRGEARTYILAARA